MEGWSLQHQLRDSATGWLIESAQPIPSWLYRNCQQTFSSPSIIFWAIQAPRIPQRDCQISVRNTGVREESVHLTELLLWDLWATGDYSMQDFPGRQEKVVFCSSGRKVLVKRKIFSPVKTYSNKKNRKENWLFLRDCMAGHTLPKPYESCPIYMWV